jgi:hypothetical protein
MVLSTRIPQFPVIGAFLPRRTAESGFKDEEPGSARRLADFPRIVSPFRFRFLQVGA